MRGFKKDVALTRAAKFADKRSFVSQPKSTPHTHGKPMSHRVLYGLDKGPARAEVFRRNREANGGRDWFCCKCQKIVNESVDDGCNEWVSVGHWDHIESRPGVRCDCTENGQVICYFCHHEKHVQVQWGATSAQREART